MIELIKKLVDDSNPIHHIRLYKDVNDDELSLIEEINKITSFNYNQITLNYNVMYKPHKHNNNIGISHIMIMGEFYGGELCVIENDDVIKINKKNEWVVFNGKDYHWVLPFVGERITLVLYNKPIK